MSHVTQSMVAQGLTGSGIMAQADGGSQSSALFWCLVLIALLVVGFVAVVWLKKWLKQDVGGGGQGFTLSELRALRDQGQMTAEEYEKARTLIVGAAAKGAKPVIPEDRKSRSGPVGGPGPQGRG